MDFKYLDAVNQLADAAHPTLHESPQVIMDKFTAAPETCFVLLEDETVYGYGIAHPWRVGNVPGLDKDFGRIPSSPDCLHVHDIVVAESSKRQGYATWLIKHYLSLAKTFWFPEVTLVSVYGTDALWSKFGFETIDEVDVSEYGPTAKYMIARVRNGNTF